MNTQVNTQAPRIVIAPDSFKGSLSALAAAEAIETGFKRVFPTLSYLKIPMADGGEGTVQAIVEATGGEYVDGWVEDPLGRPVMARFGLSGDRKTAMIEMAAASGLVLLEAHERNPLVTSTRGTGQLILKALDCGVDTILIGIGGSATNDGGMGMATALGGVFLDHSGQCLSQGGGGLGRLAAIDLSGLDPRLKDTRIEVACDVTNPLVGPNGASRIFAPQKGACGDQVRLLDENLAHLAKIMEKDLGKSVADYPGSGAAGGLGAGLMAFLSGELRSGTKIVMDATGLVEKIIACDLVITGEGRLDGQTTLGKTLNGIAEVATLHHIPVIALCGSLGQNLQVMHDRGIQAYFSALAEPWREKDLPRHASRMLQDLAEQVARLMRLAGQLKSGRW